MNTLRFAATTALLLLGLGILAAPLLTDVFVFALVDSLRLPLGLSALAGLALLWFPWRGAYMFGHYLLTYRRVGARTLLVLLLMGALFLSDSDDPSPRPSSAADPDSGAVRFATLNTLYPIPDLGPKLAFVAESKADVVSIIETRPEWPAAAEALRGAYPYQIYTEIPSSGYGYGMMLFSRFPVERVSVHPSGRLVHYRVQTPGGMVHVVQVHPHSPFTPGRLYARNRLLAELAALTPADTGGHPLVLLGDFNTVPWQKDVRQILRQQGLQLAGPTTPTFPAINVLSPQKGWKMIPVAPIDYILVPRGARVVKSETHRVDGTDHLGVSADVVLAR
jgi:endonuclease/exonuclease/phosphatase (EEP) superfamily protein YafD